MSSSSTEYRMSNQTKIERFTDNLMLSAAVSNLIYPRFSLSYPGSSSSNYSEGFGNLGTIRAVADIGAIRYPVANPQILEAP